MINNKILFVVSLLLLPIVVISFILKDKTNFNLEEKPITIRILIEGDIQEMDLEEYIVGVVAAEMPASFEIEALKAQAVASRSYALYKKNNSNNTYDLTDDINTQVYITQDAMRNKWGNDYDKYYNRIKNVVDDTQGEVMTYNGEIIEAFYFAMSSGQTQDVQSVFNENIDYLKSVESLYDNDELKNYKVIKTIGIDDFKNKLKIDCNLNVDNITRNFNNYVSSITICNHKYNGNEFRKLLELRSANFDIAIGEVVTITTYGYGHGVGMSQYGANGYAKHGYTYQDILKHYYQNIEIINLKNV